MLTILNSSMQRRRAFTSTANRAFAVAVCVFAFWLSQPAEAAEQGQPRELQFPSLDANFSMRFQHCPAGTIRPGKPAAQGEAPASTPPIAVREFYLGETEVTLAQFKAILGDEGMAALKLHAAKLQQTNPQLAEALQKGQTEPAFFVGLESVVDFCNKLQAAADENRLRVAQPSIESAMFRLPSHVEWQYAARAIDSADNQNQLPHFDRWVKLEELSTTTQQKCNEVWATLGQPGPFTGTQDDYFLLSAAGAGSRDKVKDILTEVFERAFESKPRSASGIGVLQPVGSTLPNLWNFRDVHEGVTEWTIWATQQDRARELWTRLQSDRAAGQPLIGKDNMFLSGGSFIDSYFGAEGRSALGRFSIWGGPKLTDDQPQPFAYDEEQVTDYLPGFRVLMQRKLADDWLLVMRRSVFKERAVAADAPAYVANCQKLADELAEANDPSKVVIAYYIDLCDGRAGEWSKLQDRLLKVAATPRPQANAGASDATSKLEALLARKDEEKKDAAPDGAAAAPKGDDEIFFTSLASILPKSEK